MSSWKKAAKTNQRIHRERSQLQSRQHLGILEKKKDYKLRSNDQHEKAETLKLLQKRALNRNPDEFYHHMINSRVRDGEHREKHKNDEHTAEQKMLMETQDLRYITAKRTIESNKIKRLQSELHMIDVANKVKNSHIFFVDSDDDVKNFDLAKHLDTHPQLLDRRTNRPKLSDLAKGQLPDVDAETIKWMTKERESSYKELKRRIEREKELTVTQQKMLIKKALKEKRKLKPKQIAVGTKDRAPIYEFKYERKR